MSRAASPASVPMPTMAADFPDWMDPMVVKELRQGLRARWFVVPFVAVQAAAVALVWLESLAARAKDSPFAASGLGHSLFWALVFLAVAVILPLRCLNSLTDEMAGGNSGLVRLAGLSRWKIVVGKWLTQMMLAGLILVSLAPYGLVRYFFGGVELAPNVAAFANALGTAAAMNGLLLGASGYASYWMRTLIAGTAVLYVGVVAGAGLFVSSQAVFGRSGSTFLGQVVTVAMLIGLVLTYAYFTVCGLQLARARLRVALLPWELPPSRPVLTLFFLAPLYFGFGAAITCGLGFPVVAAVMVWWISSLDGALRLGHRMTAWMHPTPPQTPPLPQRFRF